MCRLLTVLVAVSLLVGGIGPNRGSAAAMDAANVVNTPATPAETAAADVAGYRIVNGVAIYPILPGNETVVQGLLSSLAQDPDFQGISMTLYAPVGTKPKILLSNQSEDRLRYAVQKLKTIMSRMGEPHRLVVAAYLREISISNDDAVGLSPVFQWYSGRDDFTEHDHGNHNIAARFTDDHNPDQYGIYAGLGQFAPECGRESDQVDVQGQGHRG